MPIANEANSGGRHPAVLTSDVPDQEKRRVASDGHSYTFQQFLDYYGEECGTSIWNAAQDTRHIAANLPKSTSDDSHLAGDSKQSENKHFAEKTGGDAVSAVAPSSELSERLPGLDVSSGRHPAGSSRTVSTQAPEDKRTVYTQTAVSFVRDRCFISGPLVETFLPIAN